MTSLDPVPDPTPLDPPTRIGHMIDDEGRLLVYVGTIRGSDGRMAVWLPEGVEPQMIGVEVE